MTARAGVLGLQGDFAEHLATLDRLGVEGVDVRRPEQLDEIDALIIPGGESTTIGKLASQYGIIDKLKDRVAEVSRGLGEAMRGLSLESIPAPERLAVRGW